jgi:PilZ domain-containing protein
VGFRAGGSRKAIWCCMGDLFRKITESLRGLGRRDENDDAKERRRAQRIICSTPVVWEVGRQQGEGQLRELSATGLKLWSDRAILAGKHIRVRPMPEGEGALTIDVAIGTVVYSRAKGGRFEVGVELVNPERISRYAWIGRMAQDEPRRSAIPEARPLRALRLIPGASSLQQPGLLRAEFQRRLEEKNSNF